MKFESTFGVQKHCMELWCKISLQKETFNGVEKSNETSVSIKLWLDQAINTNPLCDFQSFTSV